MDYAKYLAFYVTLLFTLLTSTCGQGLINFCRATISGFGQDGLYFQSNEQESGTKVDFTIQSPGYPNYYTGKSCVCTLTTSEDQDRFSINYRFTSYRPDTKGCPSMLFIKMNDQGYSYCTNSLRPDGYTTHVHLHSGDSVKFYLANPKRYDVKAQIDVTGMVGEYTHLKCVEEKVELSEKACECKPKPPEFYMSHPEESNNTRVMLGFVGLIAFGLLFGAAVLVWYCLRRRRRRKKALEPKPTTLTRPEDSIARNSAFFSDPEMTKNAHGIYAEIDFGAGLPFSPDPSLRLEMRGENSTAKYTRGSVDSGLYSEMSEKANTNGFSPYATSNEVLGPDEKYEPPASHSSPVLMRRSSKEIEELYAKPKKSKKSKSKKKPKQPLERQQSEDIYQHPPIPNRNWNVPPSLHLLPSYNPDPNKMGSRSGSNSSSTLFTGQADLGQGHWISSRSSLNECYVTDSRSTVNLNVSKGTVETDI